MASTEWRHEGAKHFRAATETPIPAADRTSALLAAIYCELRASENGETTKAMHRLAGWLDEHSNALHEHAAALSRSLGDR